MLCFTNHTPVGGTPVIRFGTAGIRGAVPTQFDQLDAITVGLAIQQTLGDGVTEVVIGRDARTTGHTLTAGVIAGITTAGGDCIDAGAIPTPVLAHASQGRIGVMVTASHNPPQDNGIKVFVDGSEIRRPDERAIEEACTQPSVRSPWDEAGSVSSSNPMSPYQRDLGEYLQAVASEHELADDRPLDGLEIALDGGNGMAVPTIAPVLRELGASVVTFNADPSGHAPARESKPTEASISGFRRWLAGTETSYDLGMAFDGDGDRIVLVDPEGHVIHEDTVIAMLATSFSRHASVDHPIIVTTPNASARIDDAVITHGGSVERTPLGGLIEGIDSVRRRNTPGERVVFAAEPWKHLYPDFGMWIDALAAAGVLSILVMSASSLETLTAPIANPPYRKEHVRCPDALKTQVMKRLVESMPRAFPEGSFEHASDGIRVTFGRFEWLLIRPSGTEPVIRVYAEGETTVETRLTPTVELLKEERDTLPPDG